MVTTLGFDTERHTINTSGSGDVQQVIACSENLWGKESAPDRTGARRTKPVSETYYLPSWDSNTFDGNNSAPFPHGQEWWTGRWKELESSAKFQAGMLCVEANHWGDNITTYTDRGELKQGPHHQRTGDSGIHCSPPNFMSFDGYDEPHYQNMYITNAEG